MPKGCGDQKKDGAIPFAIFSLTREVSLAILTSIRRDGVVPCAARAEDHADDVGCDVPVFHVSCREVPDDDRWRNLVQPQA